MARLVILCLAYCLLSFVTQAVHTLQLEDGVNEQSKYAVRAAKKCVLSNNVLPQEKIDQIVDAHNHFRRQTPASNMQKMKWSEELAGRAQMWAEKCMRKHGMMKNCAKQWMGQNMFFSSRTVPASAFDFRQVVSAWAREGNSYTSNTHSCAPGHVCGHFTQVVWHNSKEVGCGYHICDPLKKGSRKKWTAIGRRAVVVCDYFPSGNYNGRKPFIFGHQCANCDPGQNCLDGLCDR